MHCWNLIAAAGILAARTTLAAPRLSSAHQRIHQERSGDLASACPAAHAAFFVTTVTVDVTVCVVPAPPTPEPCPESMSWVPSKGKNVAFSPTVSVATVVFVPEPKETPSPSPSGAEVPECPEGSTWSWFDAPVTKAAVMPVSTSMATTA